MTVRLLARRHLKDVPQIFISVIYAANPFFSSSGIAPFRSQMHNTETQSSPIICSIRYWVNSSFSRIPGVPWETFVTVAFPSVQGDSKKARDPLESRRFLAY